MPTYTMWDNVFRHQWKRFFPYPHKFFKGSKGQFLHATDSYVTTNLPTDDAVGFLLLSLDQSTLASQTLRHLTHITNQQTAFKAPLVYASVYTHPEFIDF